MGHLTTVESFYLILLAFWRKKNPGQTEKQENKEVNFACKIIGFWFFFSLLID